MSRPYQATKPGHCRRANPYSTAQDHTNLIGLVPRLAKSPKVVSTDGRIIGANG